MQFVITNVRNLYEVYYKLEENSDIFDGRIPMIDYCLDGSSTIILSLLENKIIGFCLLTQKNINELVSEVVSVDKNYRHQGIAKKMLNLANSYCINNNRKLISGSFSKDGLRYLQKVHESFKYEYIKID